MKRSEMSGVLLWALSAVMGCAPASGDSPGEDRPDAIQGGQAWALGGPGLPLVEVDLQSASVPRSVSDTLTVETPWAQRGFDKGGRVRWTTDLPFRPRGLFFHRVAPGLALSLDGERLPYRRGGDPAQSSWAHDHERLEVLRPVGLGAPEPGSVELTYPRAAERERRLSPEASGLEPAEFVQASVRKGEQTHQGWLLPAPSRAVFEVTVPDAAEWVMSAGLVEPEWASGVTSDGARLVLELETGEGVTPVWVGDLNPGTLAPVRVDLSRWSGETGRLVLRSESTGEPDADHVFVGQPILASRKAEPRRVVFVFMDTVRPDRLSLYGAERDTSSAIDGWAEGAVVFDAARTVAPWTLPSARTVMTGRQPEAYENSRTLGELLSEEGWATAMFAGNVYLSSNFDMHRGFGVHRVALWPQAPAVVDQAIDWLDAHDGMDAFVQVQLMEAHLPYDEPEDYRRRYAGDAPDSLREGFHLSDVRRAGKLDEAERQYVRDRYDNNLKYMTDAIARLLTRVGPGDVVVLYGDHGEEFWEHGGFEHGHSVYEELLKVPLVIAGPGIEGRRVDASVSLIDIAPTVMDLLDLQGPSFEGVSLAPVMRGDSGAGDLLEDRPLAFGRPLYGMERWGVLDGVEKWSTSAGLDRLVDLVQDPGELVDAPPPEDSLAYAERMAEDLGCPVEAGLRLVNLEGKKAPKAAMEVEVRWEPGLKAVVLGADPLENGAVEVTHEAGSELVQITWPAGRRGSREVYLVPEAWAKAPLLDARLGQIESSGAIDMGARGPILLNLSLAARRLEATRAWVPMCEEQGIRGTDIEMRDALEAMGYVDAEG